MKYWLVKTEPSEFSWEDLKAAPGQTTSWEGVRNYQARNFMREMQPGDLVLFYHSQANPLAIMGIAKVVRGAYPDPTQFDPSSHYFDPQSTPENPRWDTVDIQYYREFSAPVSLPQLKEIPGLENMVLLRKGSRLSVQPVTEREWRIVTALRE
ncbi:MAG: EVE domain-containing protein [Calditrichaceae bacterium]|nr:EVE domain-containing protein [Calditrichia bacterium]NUQ40977.1 EVE domain-containing protein [Calditrichaceae bacterium]